MSPVALPGGVTVIRDDYKAPADSIPEALAFMAAATATRKIVVLGQISDYPGRSRRWYTQAARQALSTADVVIFVGRRAVQLWGEHRNPRPGWAVIERRTPLPARSPTAGAAMLVFDTVHDATDFLHGHLRAGDLVLLKGSGQADHLERIVLTAQRSVRCWLPNCGKNEPCDSCPAIDTPGT
jgi:UDP-N-acetylmuramoyl-tripeptide--D-alanyl-D-alanine ligase